MEVNFNKNGWHARLYKAGYGPYTRLPSNLCPYFWKVVMLVALLPFTWIGYIPVVGAHDEQIGVKALATMMIKAVWLCLGFMAATVLKVGFGWADSDSFAWGMTAGVPIMAGVIFVGVFIAQAITKVSKKKLDKWASAPPKPEKPKKDSIVLAFFAAKKHKYCPVINWHEKEEKEKPLPEEAG